MRNMIVGAVAAAGCWLTLAGAAWAGPQSSPIALSSNGTRLVNVNPEVNTVSVFDATVNPPNRLAEIVVGIEPTSVAIHPNGSRAFVANAGSNTVSVIDLATNTVTRSVTVGAEPLGLALSPNGTRLYVANSSSNTLSIVNTTAPERVIATVQLGSFGSSPRALTVSNDGDADDTDETVFVALFFGQLRAGKTAVDEGQDDQREGRVVSISAATNTALGVTILAPLGDTGFNANGRLAPATGQTPSIASTNPVPQPPATPTGAYPNQLADIALHPTAARAYVVSTAASPNGPLVFNHMAQGLVSVFNTATRTEITAAQLPANTLRQMAPLNLNQGVNFTPQPRLFMTNPVAMAWRPNGSDAWVVVQNSNLVTRLIVDAAGIPTVGNPAATGGTPSVVRVDLENPGNGKIPGTAPRGIVINAAGSRAFVSNFTSHSISIIDISNGAAPVIVGTALSSALPSPGTPAATALQGAQLFFNGRGPQERMSSEGWGGCIVCHPNGRSDNVTWMFDAGPRQTIALDGMFSKVNPSHQRILNWSAVRDENQDFELNTRGVFGGRGLIDDDRLFLAIGGSSGAAESSLVEQFHQATNTVGTSNDLAGASLPNLGTFGPRRDFGVATLGDGRVFIIGGRSGAAAGNLVNGSNTIVEFNPRTNTLTRRSSVGFTPRHSLGAAAVRTSGGFRVYAVGGYSSTSSSASPVNTVQEYNPATDTWRTVASLPTAAAQFGITVAGGVNTADPRQLIHVVSGNMGSEATPVLVSTSNFIQRYQADPAGPGIWTTFTNPGSLTARRNHGAATALRGVAARIFIMGGQNAAGTVLDTVEEYNHLDGTPILIPDAQQVMVATRTPMPGPRARFGIASSLSTNQIYVIGGVDDKAVEHPSIFQLTINANPPAPGLAGPKGTPTGAWVARTPLSAARQGLGVSSPPGVTNFLPNRSAGRDPRQDSIAAWIARNVRPARAPVPATDPRALAGRSLFGKVGLVVPGFSCATCHGGPQWTRSRVDYPPPPSPADNLGLGSQNVVGAELRKTATQPGTFPGVLVNVGTFTLAGGRVNEIRFNGADVSQTIAPLGANGFNIPSLLSVHETAPYYYSGLAQTLEEVLNGSQDGNGGTRHHFVTSATQRAQLIFFLRSIDGRTPIFP